MFQIYKKAVGAKKTKLSRGGLCRWYPHKQKHTK